MRYLSLRPGAYFAKTGLNTVFLDTERDCFYILGFDETKTLLSLFNCTNFNKLNKEQKLILKRLFELDLLYWVYSVQDVICPKGASKAIEIGRGISNCEWRPHDSFLMFRDDKRASIFFIILSLTFFLLFDSINSLLKIRGTFLVLKKLKKVKEKRLSETNLDKINKIYQSMIFSRMFYPRKIECLVFSATFFSLCIINNIKVNFSIGVQEYPFFSHSWVSLDGMVLTDNQEVETGLFRIVSI